MSWNYDLDGALKLLNYRRVIHETLRESGELDLSGDIPEDLDRGLEGLQAVNDWPRLGNQLALLKRLPELHAIHLRTDKHVARLAVVVHVGRASLQPLSAAFDYTWQCVQSLEPHLKDYELSPQFIDLANSLVSKYAGSNSDVIQKAVAWLVVALNIHESNGGPQATFVIVSDSGVDGDVASAMTSGIYGGPLQKKETWGFSTHAVLMQSLAWDLAARALVGNPTNSLDKNGLARGLGL